MRIKLYLLLSFIFFNVIVHAQNVSVCSWNLKDFGKSKSDATLGFIVKTVKSFDVIALQEIVAGPGGSQAVAKLVAQLNKTGNQWNCEISNVTSGINTTERYAFIWKANKVTKVGKSWLDINYNVLIDREPYFSRFKMNDKTFTLVNFHAIPKAKHPETELKYFQFFPSLYPKDNLIFCGDFNLPQSHSVFTPLKTMGYVSALVKQKTSLRQICINDDCLASEYDNFYFANAKINIKESGIIHFYKFFDSLKLARKVSDHVPIYMTFSLKS